MTSQELTGPQLTVVVVSWNGAHLVGDCLAGLERQTLPRERYDVWLVDNASDDGTAALVARDFPAVRILCNEANLGFAGGCNSALREIGAQYAVLVNNDAVPEPDFLTNLLTHVTGPDTSDIAAVTAKVVLAPRFVPTQSGTPDLVAADGQGYLALDPNNDARPAGAVDILNSTGNEIREDGFGQDRDWLALDVPDAPASPDVFGFCGAGALLRMSAVRAAGFFDDRFFLYYEDTDLSWRLRLLGYRVTYEPRAVLRHRHAATTGEGSEIHRFYGDRNRLLCLLKNAPAGVAARSVARSLLTTASGIRREQPPWPRTGQRLRSLASFGRLTAHGLRARRRIGRASVQSRQATFGLAVPPAQSHTYRS